MRVLPPSRREFFGASLGVVLSTHRFSHLSLFAGIRDDGGRGEYTEKVSFEGGTLQTVYVNGIRLREEFFLKDQQFPEWSKNFKEKKLTEQRFFRTSGKPMCLQTFDSEEKVNGTCLYGEDGKQLWSYDRQPMNMTEETYLDQLKNFLTDWEAIAAYRRYCFRYEQEPPGEDHWMTPKEFIRGTRQGKGGGDCEEFAFLIQDVLRRRNIPASVLLLSHPSDLDKAHAICLVLEEHPDGSCHAVTACTRGIDVNGNLHGKGEWDSDKERGYRTREKALQATLRRYQANLSVPPALDPDTVLEFLKFGEKGEQLFYEERVGDLPVARSLQDLEQ